jgi:hypothetical protein
MTKKRVNDSKKGTTRKMKRAEKRRRMMEDKKE